MPHALRDLDDIWDFIASNNIFAADATLEDIQQRAGALARTPYMGIKRTDLRMDIRTISDPPYIIYYRVLELAREIEILRVIHGAMNITSETFE